MKIPAVNPDGEEIVDHFPPLSGTQIDSQEQDVAGLRVGKHLPPQDIGIGIHEAAGDRQKRAQNDGFRFLIHG